MTTVYTEDSAQSEAVVGDLSIVDLSNTSVTPLGANGVFTGQWTKILRYSQIQILAFADQPAATNGLVVQFSTDGTNVDHSHQYRVIANIGETVQLHVHAPYYRVIYTNSATPQTVFRLQSILRPIAASGTILEADDIPSNFDDAQLVKAIITGYSPTTSAYIDVKTTSDGALTVNQNTTVDPTNSTTTNLASGATYTGATVSDLNYTAVQYSVISDQNLLIYVDQSQDGVNWDITDTFEFYTSEGGSGNTIQLVAAFYRLRVKNIGVATTTFLRLQTIQVPFLPSLPRSLDLDGNLKVSVYDGITDESGFTTTNTPHGELVSATSYRLIGSTFAHVTLDTAFWTSALGTGGSVTSTNGEIVISTGTSANNTTSVVSTKNARFIGGTANKFHSHLRLPDAGATANNTRRWGIYDTSNGAFFTVINGVVGVVTRLGGADTLYSNGSFNGELGTSIVLNANTSYYTILFMEEAVWFYLNGTLLHTVRTTTTNWTSVYGFPIKYETINTGGSIVNTSIIVRSGYVHRLGNPLTQPVSFFQQGLTAGVVLKLGEGNLHGVVLSGITNNSVLTIYDNTAASGTVLWTSGPLTSNGLPFYIDMKGISFSVGLTITVTGAAVNALMMYD